MTSVGSAPLPGVVKAGLQPMGLQVELIWYLSKVLVGHKHLPEWSLADPGWDLVLLLVTTSLRV